MREFDPVQRPEHYVKDGEVECIDAMAEVFARLAEQAVYRVLSDEQKYMVGFCAGNVMKYSFRHSKKGGDQDLEKARWYAKKLLHVTTGGVVRDPRDTEWWANDPIAQGFEVIVAALMEKVQQAGQKAVA